MDEQRKDVLPSDSELSFPHFIVLKASAGSGKTHALTKRFVQFILSEKIRHNSLQNILAITFSNNAAKEMKQRVLEWLKKLSLSDRDSLSEMETLTYITEEPLQIKAERSLNYILQNYADFNVRTIDSFMTGIFRASSVDMAIDPDFEILMDGSSVFEYTMQKTIREMGLSMADSKLIEEVIDAISDRNQAFPWNPVDGLLKEMMGLYKKTASLGIELDIIPLRDTKKALLDEIKDLISKIKEIIKHGGLQLKKKGPFIRILQHEDGEIDEDLLLQFSYRTVPVKKPAKGASDDTLDAYERISQLWLSLNKKISDLVLIYSMEYYNPYIRFFKIFVSELEEIKKIQNRLLISDINNYLSRYINENIVPDIYIKLGERIHHYLIDEFQDTSPIQWRNLYPLIENTLGAFGSLFIVGDIKQAIYGFRDADYRIMMALEKNRPFPSVVPEIRHLNINYRSREEILKFTERAFKEKLAEPSLRDAAEITGLLDYDQRPRKEFKDKGFVEVRVVEENNDHSAEKEALKDIIADLINRGYRYGDIAVLTKDNYTVTQTSAWLNEMAVPFVSYSSLDIRKRGITQEIKHLLRFLDSPIDDLSFCKFLLGNVFEQAISVYNKGKIEMLQFIFNEQRRPTPRPLYKGFKEVYPEIWEIYFEDLLKKTGYLPIYDLLCNIIKTFSLFESFKSEDATLIKLLDATTSYEGRGINNLKDFISIIDENREDAEWTILLPDDNNAVRVMTIHKAKGLGFPVVILLLYAEKLNRGIPYIFSTVKNLDSEFRAKDRESTYLLKINSQLADRNPVLDQLYRSEKLKHMANQLNTLYVGFTRAEQEMYVLAVKGERDSFPFVLLPENYKRGIKKTGVVSKVSEVSQPYSPFYHGRIFDRFVEKTDSPMTFYEKKRGLLIHDILSRIYWFEPDSVNLLLKEYRGMDLLGDEEIETFRNKIEKICIYEPVRDYFLSGDGKEVLLEKEFVDSRGNLYRMDRVVISHDRVAVIDFKTGHEHADSLDRYEAQIRGYMRILRDIYPEKIIEGIIYFIDIPSVKVLKMPWAGSQSPY